MNRFNVLMALSGVALLGACSAYPNMDADYGNSVRHMVRSQTVNPGPGDTTPIESTDGVRMRNALEALRGDVSRGGTGGEPPVSIQFGGGAPQSQ